jgi:hypothetical protein
MLSNFEPPGAKPGRFGVETTLSGRPDGTPMEFVYNNPLVVGFVVLLLGFVLFMYLFIRRTVTSFREGMENS